MRVSSFRREILKFGREVTFVVEMCLSLLKPTFGQITEQENTAVKGAVKTSENCSYLPLLLWARGPLSPAELQLVLTHYLGQLWLHRSSMAGWRNYRAKGEWRDQHSIWHLHIFPYFSDTGQPHLPHSPGSMSASRVLLSRHEDTAENKLWPNKSGQLQYIEDAQLEELMSNRQWHCRRPLIMKAWMRCLSKTL